MNIIRCVYTSVRTGNAGKAHCRIFYSSYNDSWAGLSKGRRCHSQDYKGGNNAECVPLPAKRQVTPALEEGFELTSQLSALSTASDYSISPGEAVSLYKELNINWNLSYIPHPTCTPYTRLFSWPCCPSWRLSSSGKDPVGESGWSHTRTLIEYSPVWKLSSMLGCKRSPSSDGLAVGAGERHLNCRNDPEDPIPASFPLGMVVCTHSQAQPFPLLLGLEDLLKCLQSK